MYTSAQIHEFRTIKGKQMFAIYFPNAKFLMIKGKQMFAIYFPNVDILMIKGKQMFAILFVLGFITLFIS